MLLPIIFVSLCVLAIIYLALSPRFGEHIYLSELFKPELSPQGKYAANIFAKTPYKDVFFNSANGHKLHALYFPVTNAEYTILFNHGNTGNLFDTTNLLELLIATGSNVFVYDYQGYGRSSGKPTVRRSMEDAQAAFDCLNKEINIAADKIILYGESLGGALACQIALNANVAGIILQSAFSNMRQIAVETNPPIVIYPAFLYPRPYFDNANVLKQINAPVLILHGAQDDEVGIHHAKLLYDAASGKKRFVELPHTMHDEIDPRDNALFISAIKQYTSDLSKIGRSILTV